MPPTDPGPYRAEGFARPPRFPRLQPRQRPFFSLFASYWLLACVGAVLLRAAGLWTDANAQRMGVLLAGTFAVVLALGAVVWFACAAPRARRLVTQALGVGAALGAGAVAVVHCADAGPSQGVDEARYGRVTIGFDQGLDALGAPYAWRADQLAALRSELPLLQRLGPNFVEVSPGDADLVVRPFDSGPNCRDGAARWSPAPSTGPRAGVAEIDAACAPARDALARAFGHEAFHHWLITQHRFRGHLCAHPSDRADCHPRIVSTDALLSPSLVSVPSGLDGFGETFATTFPEPAAADLALARACTDDPAGDCTN